MKKKLLVCALCLLLTGCSQDTSPEHQEDITSIPGSTAEVIENAPTEETAAPEPADIYYITSHDTQDSADLTKFISQLEHDGYLWHEAEISDFPDDANILIINTPQEDLTSEEFQKLDSYMDNGGSLLFLLPASESETRYKYFNMIFEKFYIGIDYDIIVETDKNHIQEDGSIQMQAINYPGRMTFYDESMQNGIVYLRNARSFYMLNEGSNYSVSMDAMLQTYGTVIGEPCGGTEDDPLTYENRTLSVMMYSIDDSRHNAALITVGSADFLLDENFDADTSKSAQNWIYSSLNCFSAYWY